MSSWNPTILGSLGLWQGRGRGQCTGHSSPQHKLSSFKKSFVLPLLLE